MKLLIIGLCGALAAILANRGIAVFNDAVRPFAPEFTEGRMKRREFFVTTFALSFGLVVGFGIPFSVMSPIILIHSLFLGTDIIGAALPGNPQKNLLKDKMSLFGVIGSGIGGAIYGVLLVIGLGGFVDAMESLPVNIGDNLSKMGDPVIFAFAAFPALAIAYQYTIKKGLLSLGVIAIVRILSELQSKVDPDGLALLAGMVMLLIYALSEKNVSSDVSLKSLFSARTRRIRKNLPWIAAMGGLYGIACNLAFVMEGPQSLLALKDGLHDNAVAITISRALSFIPLKGMTSLSTGTFVTDGFGFVATAGLLSTSVIMAAILGAVVISVEALSLVAIANVFDKFPGIRQAADNLRNAMTQLLELALIVGSMITAQALMPGTGYMLVAGLYLLNETAGRPVVRMAVGPISVIVIGLLVNILAWVGLYTPPSP